MLAEFLKGLEALTKRANGMEVAALPGIPRKVALRQGEQFSLLDVPPPARLIALRGMDDVFALCKDQAISKDPEIFHAEDAIRIVLNRADRQDFAAMTLEKSERFQALARLRKTVAFTVKEAIQFLRVDLHGTGDGVRDLIVGLRRINFERVSGTGRTIEHGKETMGRAVEAAIQQADKVPEDFRVRVPVYMNPGLRGAQAEIRCAVTLDLEGERIVIGTLADEIQGAIDSAQADIHVKLCSYFQPALPVFNGTPSGTP